jgi:hypothetical protein
MNNGKFHLQLIKVINFPQDRGWDHFQQQKNVTLRRVLTLTLVFSLLLPSQISLVSSASAAKTGSTCTKLNTKSIDGSKPLVCKKNSSGKLVWTPSNELRISQAEFRKSLSVLKVSIDEFKGNYEIYPKASVDQYIIEENYNFSLSSNITKRNQKSPWVFGLTSVFNGEDWLSHDEISIKSDSLTLNLDNVVIVNSNIIEGKYFEMGYRSLTDKQVISFCKVINGQNIKFRLNGGGGEILEVTGNLPSASRNNFKASCTVFNGLLQGMKP